MIHPLHKILPGIPPTRLRLSNPSLFINWSLISNWSESFRYSPIGTNPKTRAEQIINALEDPNDGVFTWIKKRW